MIWILLSTGVAGLFGYVRDRYERTRDELDALLPPDLPPLGASSVLSFPTALPPLSSKALEGLSSRATTERHRDLERQHLDRARALLRSGDAASAAEDLALVSAVNAVLLHELYWVSIGPAGERCQIPPALQAAIAQSYGTVQRCRQRASALADALQGSGWLVLAWVPAIDRVLWVPIRNHDGGGVLGMVPLLALDLWEHAWFEDHGPNRATWFEALWERLDWTTAAERLSAGRRAADPLFFSLVAS